MSSAALAVTSTFSAQAADDRYIIQVDNNNNKGIVQALAKQYGATIELNANGFIAATFKGKSLNQVKGLLNNPHITLVESDERRQLIAEFVDDAGDPSIMQITPYGPFESVSRFYLKNYLRTLDVLF